MIKTNISTYEIIRLSDSGCYFEVGDTILIDNIPFAFQSIDGRYLRGAFRADGQEVDSLLGSQTLIRNAKNSRSSMSNVSVGELFDLLLVEFSTFGEFKAGLSLLESNILNSELKLVR